MTGRWPALDYGADRPVIEALHAYLQLMGKLPTRALPWTNHGWHVALQVVPHGFRTYPVHTPAGEVELLLDCRAGQIVAASSDGRSGTVPIATRSVADVFADLGELLRTLGVVTSIAGAPNEVEEAVPFDRDRRERAWDGDAAVRIHRAFADAARVMERFRSGFVGKCSPVHLFWGSFDLAVTRFSGATAPLHRGGIPNLPDAITREAYSHEVASCGFWLGGGGVEEAAFYAYGYPAPPGIAQVDLRVENARWHQALGEWILPYAVVRAAPDPDAALLAFFEASYAAVADRGGWDRAALEMPGGQYGRPPDVAALRGG